MGAGPTGRGLEESGSGFCPSFSAQQGMILFFRIFFLSFLIFLNLFIYFRLLRVFLAGPGHLLTVASLVAEHGF